MNSPGFDGPDLDGPCCAGGSKGFKLSIRLVFFHLGKFNSHMHHAFGIEKSDSTSCTHGFVVNITLKF